VVREEERSGKKRKKKKGKEAEAVRTSPIHSN
jgi:hypothetical protein